MATLGQEVDTLAAAVRPDTLKQLRRPLKVQGIVRATVASLVGSAVGLVALVLTLYLAFQSSQLHIADTAIREHQEWLDKHPKEKLLAAWKMYRYERVLACSVHAST